MIKTKKLKLALETVAVLSSKALKDIQGGNTVRSVAPVRCELMPGHSD